MAGSDSVTISGSGFTGGRRVECGNVIATKIQNKSDNHITTISPPGSTADVTRTTARGSSTDDFTYVAQSAIGPIPRITLIAFLGPIIPSADSSS